MGKWKQVSGDMDFDGVGCVLAKDNKRSRSVDLVRIDPWLELDSSALRDGYGFWSIDTTTIDYEDMGVDKTNVKDALRSVGMDVAEYKKLEPVYKAEIIASYSGYSDSTSTSDYADALPAPIAEIEFWSGPGSKYDIATINDEMRFAVISKLYGGDFDEDELPDSDILEMAFGDHPRTFDLDDDEAQAIRYAIAVFNGSNTWPKPSPSDNKLTVKDSETMLKLLEMLKAAPDSADMPAKDIGQLQAAYERDFTLDWENKREQTAYFIDEDAKEAKRLIGNLLGNLGF